MSTMSSQPVGTDLDVVEMNSFIRGYHDYMDVWTATPGDMLILKREPDNTKDSHAVAVLRDEQIVGHIPYNLAPTIEMFLRRDVNKGFAEVTGTKVNRGAGYGLELPCKYKFYGPKLYCDRLKRILEDANLLQ